MSTTAEFIPSELKILAVSSVPALGRAMEIMLRAVGFGEVKVSDPINTCKTAEKMNPDFILFTPEYLSSPVEEKLAIGCPCKERKECKKALIIMLLRKQNSDVVMTSKDMGFDSIVFADASVQKMHVLFERVYLHHNSI